MREIQFWTLTALAYSLMALNTGFESSMLNNVLVGYPLLAYCGWQLGTSLNISHHWLNNLVNYKGVTGVIIATFALAFWMIPNWMDLAASNTQVQLVKHLSLFTV